MHDIIQGNCLEVLTQLKDNSIDAIVTDPPYELGFMGKSWDNTGIANNPLMWAECLRVLKPGGHLLAFSGTRTYHRMAVAIEDAGFEVRDMIEWIYSTGFPKSLNIGKVMDKFLKTGNASWNGTGDSSNGALGYSKLQHKQDYRPEDYSNRHQNKDKITEDRAKQWEGWGTALKPAHEPICMARKPLAEKTVVENCLKWGTGGINIDESRVGTELIKGQKAGQGFNNVKGFGVNTKQGNEMAKEYVSEDTNGRFPANLILEDCEEVRECFPESKSGAMNGIYKNTMMKGEPGVRDGKEIYLHQEASSGNASRFFKSIIYQAKASKSERNRGLEDFEDKERVDYGGFHSDKGLIENNRNPENRLPTKNNHPTVKPIALMEYLIKMVTPKGGIVLDPFAGSGSTLVAAKQNGFQYVGIELDKDYCIIAESRLKQKTLKQEVLF